MWEKRKKRRITVVQECKEFGISVGKSIFFVRISEKWNWLPERWKKKRKRQKIRVIQNFLSQQFTSFIQKYPRKPRHSSGIEKKIRCCRWQGETQAPEIVKICLNNIRKWKGEYEVICLDKNNYTQYCDFPVFIIEKVKNNEISLTHFSDIMRMYVLKTYGGIRVDATMFIHQEIFSEFTGKTFNSVFPKQYIAQQEGFTKRCGFLMGGMPGGLFAFCYDFFLAYHQKYHHLIDYFLIDYVIDLAYRTFPEIQEAIDQITLTNEDLFTLGQLFPQRYDEKKYKNLMKTGYFKLTYKNARDQYTSENELTYYGKFIHDFGEKSS